MAFGVSYGRRARPIGIPTLGEVQDVAAQAEAAAQTAAVDAITAAQPLIDAAAAQAATDAAVATAPAVAAQVLSQVDDTVTQAAATAVQDAVSAVAPAAAQAIRAEVVAEADRAETAASSVAQSVVTIDRVGQAVETVTAPALRRSTDAQYRVHDLVDMMGGLHLPGLGGVSVQDHVTRLREDAHTLATRIAHHTVIDAVADLGCDPNGRINCRTAVNAAIAKLSAQTSLSGPATIFFPRGVYRIEAGAILPKSNVSIVGSGRDEVRFMPVGTGIGFARTNPEASPSNYLERCIFRNFTVDGSQQTLTGGVYNVATKGMYFMGFRQCVFSDLRFEDTAATSLGIDFADNSIIQRVLVRNGGRLAAPGQPGASGIGIGTGWQQEEPLLIADCLSEDCTNYGIFVERQGTVSELYTSRHTIVSGCISRRNNYGFGEAGCEGALVIGNQLTDNLSAGVVLHRGTVTGSKPGDRALIHGNQIVRNGGPGIKYDGAGLSGTVGYSSDGNRIEGNAGAGHSIAGGAGAVDDFAISDKVISGNGGHGVHIVSGTLTNVDVIGARMLNNTGSAVHIAASITGGRIAGCTMRDLRGGTATQTGSITGAGALTDFDISENVGVGCGTIALTGTQTRVTTGRNVGM